MGVFDGMFDVIVDTFREDAQTTYTAPGAGAPSIPCRVMLDRRDTGARPDNGQPPVGQMTLEVLASEVANPEFGGVFKVGEKQLTVSNRPQPVDGRAELWTMWVE